MKSLRQAIQKSWFPNMTIIRGNLATALQLSNPLSLNQLTQHLYQPETKSFKRTFDADAFHGEVEFIMRSDGSYTFRGHLRATGFPSFAYKLQVLIRSAGAGAVIALEASGRVFGTDTPGDRQRNWEENNISPAIRQFWMALRSDAQLETNIEKNLSGVLGGIVDVAKTVVEVFIAAEFRGIVGAVIMLGSEVGSAAGITIFNPNILAGVAVGGGILAVFGSSFVIPVVAAGATGVATATGLLGGLHSRRMYPPEIELAKKVFKDKIPIDKIWITNMYNPSKNGIACEFTIPSIDGSILVNMGKNYYHTLEPDIQGRGSYKKPGEVFIHELVHAWQIHYSSFVPGMLCKVLGNNKYEYDINKVKEHIKWSSFNLEQQASIVDGWFGEFNDNTSGLESPAALNDPRFFYIFQNIRLGQT
jgi:hypothetical protein